MTTTDSTANDLYSVLQVSKTATDAEIKKQYYKLALKYHPDKSSQADATDMFKQISQAYSVLSDPQLRKRYDRTGEMDGKVDSEYDWSRYFEDLFGRVTEEDLRKFELEYKHSDEERRDLMQAYIKCKGDFNRILENVMMAECEDEDRLIQMIEKAIADGELNQFAAKFKSTTTQKQRDKRRKQAGNEAQEAEQLAKELGLKSKNRGGSDGDDALKQLILERSKKRANDFLDQLEQKYANAGPSKRKSQKK